MNIWIILLILNYTIIQATFTKRYEPNWPSLDSRPLPVWYDQSKIGLFIHFGVFAVPSFVSEWFWNFWKVNTSTYIEQHDKILQFMKENYSPKFSYANFADQFQAEFFNATYWASIVKRSGARYAVLTTKHHEGFTLWPSTYSFNWNSLDIGPKRDIVGEFCQAIRNENIHLGLYYSLFEWFHPLYLFDMKNNYTTHQYVKTKARPELEQLINIYKPELLWSDGDAVFNDSYWNSTDILAWLYNDSPVKDFIVTNDRWGTNCHNKHGGFFNGPDRYDPNLLPKHKWESAISLDRKSWGFRRELSLDDLLTTQELIEHLLKTISYGGNILINVGPNKEGQILPIFEKRLISLGNWLSINGEAIYESQIYDKCQITNNTKFYTVKKNFIYGISLKWPKNGILEFECIDFNQIKEVNMLGIDTPIQFKSGQTGIVVQFPNWNPNSKLKYAYSFKFKK